MSSRMCALCGLDAVEEVTLPHRVNHHDQHRTIQDRCMRCTSCGNISYLGDQIADHQLAVANAIRDIDGLLSAEQLRSVRAKYKLKQTDMEQMLSIGPKTWTRWERGKVTQSKSTDILIRAIAENPIYARKLMEQSGVVNHEALAVFDGIENSAISIARASLRGDFASDLEGSAFVEKVISTIDNARQQAAEEVGKIAA